MRDSEDDRRGADGTGWHRLTAAQQSLADAQRLDPQARVFWVADVVELTGDIRWEKLREAIRSTVLETDALQVRFTEVEDELRQAVRPLSDRVADLEIVDLSGAAEPAAAAQQWMATDLDSAPGVPADFDTDLSRYVLFRLGPRTVWWYQRHHHVLIDGYGIAVVARRVAERYRAVEPVESLDPGALATLWAEDAAYAESPEAEADEAAFLEVFNGPSRPPTPTALAHGAAITPASRRAHRQPVPLAPETIRALKDVTTANRRYTWADVFTAGWAAFVARRTGDRDLVLSLPVAARTTPTALRTPAMAVNVLPLRVVIADDDNLLSAAATVATTLRTIRRHQRLRGERLAARFATAGTTWLLRGPGINLKPYPTPLDFDTAKGLLRTVSAGPVDDVDLSVSADGSGGLDCFLEANPDRYSAEELGALAGSFAAFLALALTEPHCPFPHLAALPVRPGWLDTPATAGVRVDPSQVLFETVQRQPGHPAVTAGGTSLSFRQLRERITGLARVLRDQGAGPERVVAVALPRGVESVVAIFAVLEAGAAYLPVDLDYPAGRIEFLLADADPHLVLTTSDTALARGPRALLLDQLNLASAEVGTVPRWDPKSAAYLIYTSGSTGKPKGVLVSRDSLAFLLAHHGGGLFAEVAEAAGRQLRAAHTASFAFDSSWEQLLWLITGHHLVVYDEDDRRDAQELVAAIERDRIDCLDVTPSMASALVSAGLLESAHRPQLFLIGGEPAPKSLWAQLAQHPMRSHNFYGPTEATVDALGAPVCGDRPSIGRPLAGTMIRVLDSALQPVPAGLTGELYLSGPHLARGYHNRPGLTAGRFVADPLGGPGSRMYRTGDLVRVERDESVTFLGRTDGQIKIRGHRVELGEVIDSLGRLPGVRQAHARLVGEPARLVGYLTASELAEEAALAMLRSWLPEPLVPAGIILLDSFPTTVHGKLDEDALPDLSFTGHTMVDPDSLAEHTLCAAFAEVLGLTRVSATADFFTLGGDSISAIGVSSLLRRQGWRLRPRDLFTARTARGAARLLEPLAEGSAVAAQPHGEVPMTPIVAALAAAAPDPAAIAGYAQSVTIPVSNDIPDERIVAACAVLRRRHPALTLRVQSDPQHPGRWRLQTTPEPAALALIGGTDVAGLRAQLVAGLDPAQGRIVAFGRVRATAELVVAGHHLAVDGVSWRVLTKELLELLNGAELGPDPEGPAWRDQARQLAEAGEQGRLHSELKHWQLVTDRPCDLLGAFPLGVTTHGSALRVIQATTVDIAHAIIDLLPTQFGGGPDTALAGALALTLRRALPSTAPEPELLMTWESHGRDALDGEAAHTDTVGWFTTEFPVRLRLPKDSDPVATLKAARQARAEVPGHGLGFGVLRWLDPNAGPLLAEGHSPGVLLNYLGRFDAAALGGDRAFEVSLPDGLPLTHALEVNVFNGSGGLLVEWTFAAALRPFAQRIQDAWGQTLLDLATLAREHEREPGVPPLIPAECTLAGLDQQLVEEAESDYGPLFDIAPLSPLQEGLLFHALRDGQEDAYRTATTLRLRTPAAADGPRLALDPARLETALQQVVTASPQLLAAFVADRFAQPAQLIGVGSVPVTVHDLRDLEPSTRAARQEEIEQAAQRQAFDPSRPPLLRATLVRTADDAVDLTLVAHHLILDGWSTPLLLEQLLQAYAGIPLIPSLPTYRRYLDRVRAADPDGCNLWRDYLAGAEPSRLAAPSDAAPGPAAVVAVELEPSTTERLIAAMRAAGLTLSTVVGGAWAVVLGRWLGRDDLLVGATVSGRGVDVPRVEDLLGLLSSTVPLRFRLRPGIGFGHQLAEHQVNRAVLAEHETLGLSAIEATSTPGAGLFDTLVVIENYPDTGPRAAGRLELVGIDNAGGTHYPVTVTALPGPDLRIVLDHDLTRISAEQCQHLADDLAAVLTGLAADLNTPPDRLLEVPGTPVQPVSQPAPDMLSGFLTAVRECPNQAAVILGGQDVTFAALAGRAAAFAVELRARGLPPEAVVAVALGREADAIAALLACLATGLVYVPIDPDHPAARQRETVTDSGARVVIAHPDSPLAGESGLLTPKSVPAHGGTLVTGRVPGHAAAYVIYTSGSTGRPKGVMVSRGALDRHCHGLQIGRNAFLRARVGERVRAAHSASFSFDASFGQLSWLFGGDTLVVLDADERRDPAAFVSAVRRHRVHCIDVAPVLAEQLVAEGLLDAPWPLPDLYLGGEAVPAALWSKLREAPHTTTLNLYGPTETCVDALAATLDQSSTPIIGEPVLGITARVLDTWLRPVPEGVPGELYLAGAQLARGYLGRPGLTAERFVADPWHPGQRMYRTGDAARIDAEGLVTYCGRLDDQVKIGGYRVEPGEVAGAVREVAGVGQAAVITEAGHGGLTRLVAFATATPGARDQDLPTHIRAVLADSLPPHLIPAAVLMVDELPTTVAGKVDTSALAALAAQRGKEKNSDRMLVAPDTAAERALVTATAAVLGVPQVSVTDDFFVLGGHSLTALRLLAAMRAAGFSLTVRDIFGERSLRRIAATAVMMTGATTAEVSASGQPALPTAGEDARDAGSAPVSGAQRRLLFLAELEGPSATYTVPLTFLLNGTVDPLALRRAWSEVVARHAILRTVYRNDGGDFSAEILPAHDALVAFVHRRTSSHDLTEEIARCEAEPFDLFDGTPPVRAWWLQVDDRRSALVICIHHLAIDEESVAPLMADLSAAYRGRDLAPLPAGRQFGRYAEQPEVVAAADRRFWEQQLVGMPTELDLPYDRRRPGQASYHGQVHRRIVPPKVVDGVNGLAAELGVSPLMVVQTAVATLFRRLGAGTDIPLGSPVTARDESRFADAVGYFVNMIVLRLDVSAVDGFAGHVRRTSATVLAALEHSRMPFEAVVDLVAPERSLARHPLFQTMVAYDTAAPTTLDLPGVDAREHDGNHDAARFDLAFRYRDGGAEDTTLTLTSATDVFDGSTAAPLLERLLLWLEQAVANPRASMIELDPLLAGERAGAMLDPVRRTRPVLSVLESFADQVLLHPETVALVGTDATLSYGELAIRVAQLAAELRVRGVGREDVVAVALSRRTPLVVGLLATMAVSASYLPLDVDYPAERLEYMIADSDPVLVLTDHDTAGKGAGRPEFNLDTWAPGAELSVSAAAAALRVPAGAQAAYVIYTSGSTGKPKGVVVATDALAAFTDHTCRELGMRAGQALVSVTTVSFDIFGLELFVPLASGATVALAGRDEVRDPDQLLEVAQRVGCTHLQATPSLWRPLLEQRPHAFAGLVALVGGEALPPDLAVRLVDTCQRVINVYGPTEATIWATSAEIVRDPGSNTVPVSLGEPFTEVGVRVLDEHLQPVPAGAAGELYLTGVQLARGYHRRPALTAGRFVADPHGGPGARMYRTGDLVRRDSQQRLLFLRRTDDQVKVHGFRIELGEVENHLRTLPGIHRAAAVVRPDSKHVPQLLGYVVAAEGHVLDLAALRRELARRVPPHLVPQHVGVLAALPLTLNGKVDRQALPEPDTALSVGGRGPETESERLLCTAVGQVLDRADVLPEDAFFTLGGDSISAIRLVSVARDLGLRITPRQIFTHPTLAALAADSQQASPPAPAPGSTTGGTPPAPRRTRVSLNQRDLSTIAQLLERRR